MKTAILGIIFLALFSGTINACPCHPQPPPHIDSHSTEKYTNWKCPCKKKPPVTQNI